MFMKLRLSTLLILILFKFSSLYSQTQAKSNAGHESLKKENRNTVKDSVIPETKPTVVTTFHFQATVLHQKHLAFKAAFNGVFGANGGSTLDNKFEQATSLTSTIFFGTRLWTNASAYFNPEISGGRGFSAVTGIAGFPNGETYKVGNVAPIPFVGRAYFQQILSLSDESVYQEDDVNQLAGYVPVKRLTFRAGKFSLLDIFDDNVVSHDPRSDFMNWALMGMGAWDYPADTRGYTLGVSGAYTSPKWSLIFAASTMPTTGNGPHQDLNVLKAHSFTFQVERKFEIVDKPGKIKVIFYDSKYNGPYYADLIRSITLHDTLAVNKGTGYRGIKWGGGVNLEQVLTNDLTLGARASWSDGHAVTWAFTPIDRSYSLGLKLTGRTWGRPQDVAGLSGLLNGLATIHKSYLAAGGLDYLIGDGKLPKYSMEKIIEVFYAARFKKVLFLTPDYQFVNSPAYNPLRGPVHVFSFRFHFEY